MSRVVKMLAAVFISLAILLVIGITLTIGWRPFLGPRVRPLTARVFEKTPERVARGKYLTEGVVGCLGCHSPHDWTRHDAAVPPGKEGSGEDMSSMKGLPGTVVAPNLTPDPETGTGNWTDDMFARAIREGIGHDGRTLFPLMPYASLRQLSDEDLASVVVFLRSLPAVNNPLPATDIAFPVKYLIRSAPQPVDGPVPTPDVSTMERRGAYLVRIAGCGDCHTPQDKGQPIAGLDFGGGAVFEGPWGRVASANLTPDPSGIPYYDEALFLQAMRTGTVKARTLNQIMPWHEYRNMTDDDLKAVFAHVKALKPVKHLVDNTEPPTYCPVCRSTHGGGNQNQKP